MKEKMTDGTYGDFAETFARWQKQDEDIQKEITNLNTLIGKLDALYTASLNAEIAENDMNVAAATEYKELYKAFVAYLEGQIEDIQAEIDSYNKILALMETGSDEFSVSKALAEQKLQYSAEKLAVAKTNLDAAKATYDEVIAKYLNK